MPKKSEKVLSEDTVEYARTLLTLGLYMHLHLFIFLAKEKDVGRKYECNPMIEIQNSTKIADKESVEGVKLLQIIDKNFNTITA